jgi:hypothetical protein
MDKNVEPNMLALENDFLREQNLFYKKIMLTLLDYIVDENKTEELILKLLEKNYPVTQLVYDINLDEDLVLKVAKLHNYIKEI